MEEKSLQALRAELRKAFQSHGVESPDADAGLLLMHVLGIDKTRLLTQNFVISKEQVKQISVLARRRIAGEPMQYILGSAPFMDLEFTVNSSTLIPRPETELLVEAVQERLVFGTETTVIWDIGCGSGCIGISLAHLCPKLRVVELDISKEALKTAKDTALRYGLAERITFMEHDILQGMPDLPSPQAIVSNPPYIKSGELDDLQREVRGYEPLSALDGGEDGLCFYRKMIAEAPLAKGGLLAFEIGYDQGDAVVDLMQKNGYQDVLLLPDLAGLDRIVLGYHG